MAVSDTDPLLSLIAGLDPATPSTGFYNRLCEVVCDAVDLDRAVFFQYDVDLRRVRPLGGFGIEATEIFGPVHVSPDTAGFVREALEHDAVVEIGGAELAAEIPAAFQSLAAGRRAVCVPVVSSGTWVGLLLADRADAAPVLTDAERVLLLDLGKAVALATMARRVTRRDEHTKMLRQRVDMAREVHDRVIQRLFGVSLALGGDGPLSDEDRRRCATEIKAAMEQLRDTVGRGQAEFERTAPDEPLGDFLQSWYLANDDVELQFTEGSGADVPQHLAAVVHDAVMEALRNARKHAIPTRIDVRTAREDGAMVVEIVNDGVGAGAVDSGGAGAGELGVADEGAARHAAANGSSESSQMGLRLLAIEAIQAGGLLEYGPRPEGRWAVRLLVPVADA